MRPGLKTFIMKILNNHSGGVKFTELIVELAPFYYDAHLQYQMPDPSDLEIFLREEMSNEVGILEYVWHMDEGLNRVKMFVYEKE